MKSKTPDADYRSQKDVWNEYIDAEDIITISEWEGYMNQFEYLCWRKRNKILDEAIRKWAMRLENDENPLRSMRQMMENIESALGDIRTVYCEFEEVVKHQAEKLRREAATYAAAAEALLEETGPAVDNS